jgi:alkylation response protein AidB-like acyl-CoA dehydrogenase
MTTGDEQLVRDRVDQLLREGDPKDRRSFLGMQYDLGLAWVQFPEGAGGLGLRPSLQRIVAEALAAKGIFPGFRGGIGMGMAAPTIATHGNDEQRRKYLRPLFTGEEIWCQLFSEPGAGSDLASLSTRAVRDGDEWIVNGQKVWTSGGHLARRGILVTRTDPDVPKHRGLTYFVADMHAPGVEVRPLRQMTGAAEFNEVYLTDVRIPDEDRLDAVGNGWAVALTTLMNERVSIGGGGGGMAARPAPAAAAAAGAAAGHDATAGAGVAAAPPAEDAARVRMGSVSEARRVWEERGKQGGAVARDRLVSQWMQGETLRLMNQRAANLRRAGNPGPDGSLGKLGFSTNNQKSTELAINLMGMDGTLYATYDLVDRPGHERQAPTGRDDMLRRSFLRARANSIEGGTSEVLRNIIGERVLGLPGDIRVDKDRPWIEVPR